PLDLIVAVASVVLGLVVLAVALLESPGVMAAVLVVGGLGWLLAIASLNVSVQYSLPGWVRARGLAVYLLLFGGGTAGGSALWGVIAGAAGTKVALVAAAAALVVGAAGALRYRLRVSERLRPSPGPSLAGAGGRRRRPARPGSSPRHGRVRGPDRIRRGFRRPDAADRADATPDGRGGLGPLPGLVRPWAVRGELRRRLLGR